MSAYLIAIDPGAISGAFAAFADGRGVVAVGDLAVVDGQLDAASFAHLLEAHKPGVAVIEKVGAMPGQGVASTFKFGKACGLIEGTLAALNIPFHLVSPPVWKKSLGLRGKDKEASRALAIRLYPSVRGLDLKKHQNRAEALLIGHWYRHHKGHPGGLWKRRQRRMTIETKVRCDRCGKYETEFDEHWTRLNVQQGEDSVIPYEKIDICPVCEADFVRFMAGEVFHKFMEKSK